MAFYAGSPSDTPFGFSGCGSPFWKRTPYSGFSLTSELGVICHLGEPRFSWEREAPRGAGVEGGGDSGDRPSGVRPAEGALPQLAPSRPRAGRQAWDPDRQSATSTWEGLSDGIAGLCLLSTNSGDWVCAVHGPYPEACQGRAWASPAACLLWAPPPQLLGRTVSWGRRSRCIASDNACLCCSPQPRASTLCQFSPGCRWDLGLSEGSWRMAVGSRPSPGCPVLPRRVHWEAAAQSRETPQGHRAVCKQPPCPFPPAPLQPHTAHHPASRPAFSWRSRTAWVGAGTLIVDKFGFKFWRIFIGYLVTNRASYICEPQFPHL